MDVGAGRDTECSDDSANANVITSMALDTGTQQPRSSPSSQVSQRGAHH